MTFNPHDPILLAEFNRIVKDEIQDLPLGDAVLITYTVERLIIILSQLPIKDKLAVASILHSFYATIAGLEKK